jgi:hypothetical protein
MTPLKIVLELGVSGFDELGQGRAREIAILVVDRLDPRTHRPRATPGQTGPVAEYEQACASRIVSHCMLLTASGPPQAGGTM